MPRVPLALLLGALGSCVPTPPPADEEPRLVPSAEAPPPPPQPDRYAVWGVDASHYQGRVDWTRLSREPRYAFAYLKATQGVSYVDPRFGANWQAARAAGLRVGAYHFLEPCHAGDLQARHFLAVVPKSPNALPPVLDLEDSGACPGLPDPEAVRQAVRDWISRVTRATGQRPLVYVNGNSYAEYLEGSDIRADLWVRSVDREPSAPEDPPWLFWQFEDGGSVRGVKGAVDLDAYVGDLFSLEGLARPPPARRASRKGSGSG